jgi:hypothetical protein
MNATHPEDAQLRIYLENEQRFLPKLLELIQRTIMHKTVSGGDELVSETEKVHIEDATALLEKIAAQEFQYVDAAQRQYVVVTVQDLQRLHSAVRLVIREHAPIKAEHVEEVKQLIEQLQGDEKRKFTLLLRALDVH